MEWDTFLKDVIVCVRDLLLDEQNGELDDSSSLFVIVK
jgi:hypothetical protein